MDAPVRSGAAVGLPLEPDSLEMKHSDPSQPFPEVPLMFPLTPYRTAIAPTAAKPASCLYSLLSLAKEESIENDSKEMVLEFLGDHNFDVRRCALKVLERIPIREPEALCLERLLIRQEPDLRRGVLANLLRQDDVEALSSARRLLASGLRVQRLGGLELLRRMIEAGRSVDQCRRLAAARRP